MTGATPLELSVFRLDGDLPDLPVTARPASLDAALKRLAAALDQLEAASGRLTRADAERSDLREVLAAMQDDRSRLAGELDAAVARTEGLEHAAREIGQRLETAGGVLRDLLAAPSSEV